LLTTDHFPDLEHLTDSAVTGLVLRGRNEGAAASFREALQAREDSSALG